MNKLNINIVKNKRLEGEYKKLSALKFLTKIDIQNQTDWIINFEPIKKNNISIKLIFSNYPINPPIVKLISSSHIKITGLVDLDGNITTDIINPANWKITNNLSEIITILYKCFNESL
jgi:ubiquitin-protein ligase